MKAGRHSSGFTLIEVIIAVALVGIMAAAIGPVAFQQVNKARHKATAKELEAIKDALQDYYEDTGRFPDPGDALEALVSDPGDSNWAGPYLGEGFSDPVAEVTTDAFGQPYCYDSNPTLVPAGFAEIVVASKGVNRYMDLTGDLTTPGQTWNMSQTHTKDDIVITVSIAAINREKEKEAEAEIEALADAVKDYYLENGDFPDSLAVLKNDYLSAGIDDDNFIDGWKSAYVSWTAGSEPTILSIISTGPDRIDDSGGNDDILLEISDAMLTFNPDSVIVYLPESLTEFMARVAQDSLDAHPEINVYKGWHGGGNVRELLGFTTKWDKDEWGKDFKINETLRLIFSKGPDDNENTTEDNIPPGIGPD